MRKDLLNEKIMSATWHTRMRLTNFGLKLQPIGLKFNTREINSCSNRKHLLPSHQGDFFACIIFKATSGLPSPAMAMLSVLPLSKDPEGLSGSQSALQYMSKTQLNLQH